MEKIVIDFITGDLDQNEELIWYAKPYQGVFLDIQKQGYILSNYIVPFLIFMVLLFFFQTEITQKGLSIIAFVVFTFAIPILIGLIVLLVIEPLKRENTVYALTNRRIIIRSKMMMEKNKSIDLDTVTRVNVRILRDGIGTIQFTNITEKPLPDLKQVNKYYLAKRKFTGPQFELIENCLHIYNLIKETQHKAIKE